MRRRDFLKFMGVAAAGLWLQGVTKAAASRAKPNIILIFADDLGYGELSAQGCLDIPTPNIDSIAKNGVRFTQGYVTHPVCAPSRAGLMTGRYQHRFGFEYNPGPEAYAEPDFGIEPKEITIAERLKTFGYKTGLVGKWHIGFRPECRPQACGFDEFFGFLSGANAYHAENRKNPIWDNGEEIDEPAYLTDAFGREAVSFIERHKDKPFFLYLSFNAVHLPMEATDEDMAKFPEITDEDRLIYAGMTEAMDRATGKVLDTLRKLKLEENTLVFFISDNGGPTSQTTSSNKPLRGYKGQMYEGGVRVPFLIQWKGKLPAGKLYDYPVSSLDVHATSVSAAGKHLIADWELDGVNLLPYLKGENNNRPHETLFWRSGNKFAVRHKDWKLVLERDNSEPQLFNLAQDIGETRNLADKEPEKVKELQNLFDKWSSQMEPARWIRRDSQTEANGETRRTRETTPKSRFEAFDQNKDGNISKDEMGDASVFDRMNTNSDDIVTIEEVREYFRNRRRKR